jgi:hypothetical protein
MPLNDRGISDYSYGWSNALNINMLLLLETEKTITVTVGTGLRLETRMFFIIYDNTIEMQYSIYSDK